MTDDIIEPRHEISNNAACATSKVSDQPAHIPVRPEPLLVACIFNER